MGAYWGLAIYALGIVYPVSGDQVLFISAEVFLMLSLSV